MRDYSAAARKGWETRRRKAKEKREADYQKYLVWCQANNRDPKNFQSSFAYFYRIELIEDVRVSPGFAYVIDTSAWRF